LAKWAKSFHGSRILLQRELEISAEQRYVNKTQ